jgi:hypothetical protein
MGKIFIKKNSVKQQTLPTEVPSGVDMWFELVVIPAGGKPNTISYD